MALITIHAEPGIRWHIPFAIKMAQGLQALGIPSKTTSERSRVSDTAILLGTTLWRGIEATGKYLLVDRASWGDPLYVSLVWNGHGRRGNHCVPHRVDEKRWLQHGVELKPWRTGSKTVLAGQTESYSPLWASPNDWYRSAANVCTHFRPHPAGENPTQLPEWKSFDDVGRMVTLNSSVAVDAIINGIPTVVEDRGGMAWPGFTSNDDRLPWLRWLAWTQFSHDEIAEGLPIRHLFDGAA